MYVCMYLFHYYIIPVVDELLITVLDSNKLELVYATCGVLVNITGDPNHRDVLGKNQGVKKYVTHSYTSLCMYNGITSIIV